MTSTRDEFRAHAKEFRAVPVTRELLADLTTPMSAYLRCLGDEPGFLLESVENGERWGRFSFAYRRPHATIVSQDGEVTLRGSLPDDDLPLADGLLATLEAILARYQSPRLPDLPPLIAGLVGYIGFDVVREVEHLPNQPTDDTGSPDALLDVIGEMFVFDHWRQRATLVAVALLPDNADEATIDAAYDDAVARVDQLAADGARAMDEPMLAPPEDDPELPEFTSTMNGGLYQAAVRQAKEYVGAGDIFQVVLSQRFDFELDADPADVYRVLRQINPSPYSTCCANLRSPWWVVRLSLVQVREGRVISRPIAGTRRRGRTDTDDRRMAAELSEDPKERAEHVMLVDLARNDLGRVVEYGSLTVAEMMTLERFSHVMHLTSQVEGDLRPEMSVIDVLRATIPAGTVSGAPKVRAMEIIDELEPVRRGPYSGLVGYLDFTGNLDSAITIRTMVVADGRGSVQAGAGIVADSDPELEDLECHNKAKALLAAVVPARRMTAARRQS